VTGVNAQAPEVPVVAVLALIGVILLVLAGVNVAAPRFNPGWLGLAFISAAVLWAPLTRIGG
jgi:hypothetical protein